MSETPHVHDQPDAWHQHSEAEGMPQEEHAASVNPTALGITFVATVFGVVFVIVLLTAYFNTYTYTYRAQQQEGIPKSRAAYETAQASDETRLNSYGWIDRNAGTVHLPIEAAFDQVVEQYGENGS